MKSYRRLLKSLPTICRRRTMVNQEQQDLQRPRTHSNHRDDYDNVKTIVYQPSLLASEGALGLRPKSYRQIPKTEAPDTRGQQKEHQDKKITKEEYLRKTGYGDRHSTSEQTPHTVETSHRGEIMKA